MLLLTVLSGLISSCLLLASHACEMMSLPFAWPGQLHPSCIRNSASLGSLDAFLMLSSLAGTSLCFLIYPMWDDQWHAPISSGQVLDGSMSCALASRTTDHPAPPIEREIAIPSSPSRLSLSSFSSLSIPTLVFLSALPSTLSPPSSSSGSNHSTDCALNSFSGFLCIALTTTPSAHSSH